MFVKRPAEDNTKLEVIRRAVLAGEESGVAAGDVMKEIRERMRKRALASLPPRMRNLKI
jgi:hypothetical protein